ncbi:MAG: EamA family transporter [Halanaerobiales bacterium]|nr:EamA family transporter [Halanaerobiales bacterium]
MNNKKILPIIAIVATVILWGISFISIKVSLEVLPPMTLALLRFIIASILLVLVRVFMSFKLKKTNQRINKKDIPLMALTGFIGVTLYFFFENYGIKLTTASAASIIIATIPIFSLIAEAIVFKSKLTTKKIIGVIVSMIGVCFIIGGNLTKLFSSNNGKGYVMMFAAVLSWVIYSLVTKPLFKKYSQLTIVFYQTIYGTILLIPFVIFETTNWNLLNHTIVLNVVYLGVFCSAVGYYLYVYSLDHLGISTSSLYLNLIPLIAIISSYFILGEMISLNQILGGILVIVSVYLVTWEGKMDTGRVVKQGLVEEIYEK